MQKYRIVIAGEGVREEMNTDLNSLGFELLPTESVSEAFEAAEKADVLLLDMSLSLEEGFPSAPAKYDDARIIAVSGNNCLSVAREAMRLGAADCISRPIEPPELSEALLRVRHSLDERLERKRKLDKLRESRESMLPVLRERFLDELLRGALSAEEINRQLSAHNLSVGKRRYKMAIVFEAEPRANDGALFPPEYNPLLIKQIITDELSPSCDCAVFLSASYIIAITAWDDPGFVDDAIAMTSGICSRCLEMFELKLTAGIGNYYDSVENIRESFREAKSALEHKAIAGAGRTYYIGDLEHSGVGVAPYDSRSEERFFSAVKFGSDKQISLLASEMFLRLEGCAEWERQAYTLNIFNEVYKIVLRYELQTESSVMDILERFAIPPARWMDERIMREMFVEMCLRISGHIKTKRKMARSSLANEAKRYIELHYKDGDLSVAKICAHLHVSQSYFSTVFKRETGAGFVRYLTELRMSRAIALLQQTDEKTYIIANKVGYDDPNYFSYVFKRRFGVSPAQYRR